MKGTQLSYTTQWNELADIKDELAARDWFPGTSGNLSIKVVDSPLQFLVTASGRDKRKRTSEDFLLVNEFSQPLEDSPLKPSAETILHQRIYEKTEAGCSLHVHTVANNVISELYANEGEITFQHQELIKAFNLWEEDASITIPIVPNYATSQFLQRLLQMKLSEECLVFLYGTTELPYGVKMVLKRKSILRLLNFCLSII